MTAIDYYGRLLRRAHARVDAEAARVEDPFDVTALWPLDEGEAAPALVAREAPPVVLQPSAPVPGTPPSPGGRRDDRVSALAAESLPGVGESFEPGSDSAQAEVNSTFAVRDVKQPAIAEGRAIPLTPGEAPRVAHESASPERPIDSGIQTIDVVSYREETGERATSSTSREGQLAVPLVPPPIDQPRPAWTEPRDETSSAPAPPPASKAETGVAAGEGRKAAQPATRVIVVRDSTGGAWRGNAAADQDLLRGPTYQVFGIGQV